MKQYTVEQIRNYILSQDSLGDVLYNLTEEKIDEANHVIKIIGCVETVDNWGNENKLDEQETYKLLINPDEWTDDQRFYDEFDNCYFVDDLVGKKIQVGPYIFTLQEE